MKKFLISAMLSSLFVGCASQHQSTVKTAEVIRTPITSLMVSDLIILDEKYEHTVSGRSGEVNSLKEKAQKELLEKVGADVLIDPTYHVETQNMVSTLTIYSRAGNYRNFRNASDEELMTVSQYGIEKKVEKPVATQKQTNNSGNVVLQVALGIVGVILLITLL